MKNKLRACILALILLPAFTLAAMDIGILLDQGISYDQAEQVQYSCTLIPWFSSPIRESSDLYISAGVTVLYEFEEWHIIPELLRTELTLRMEENGDIHIGRIPYADPLGFVAGGLFDGVRYIRDLADGSVFGAGIWYTGLLYKKNANITMTEDDLGKYNAPVDYDNFADTYFAPRRLIAAVDWEHPGIREVIRLRMAFIGQFDLSGGESLYHTQYLIAKAVIPVNSFVFELGGTVGLAQNAGNFQVSFAGEAGIAWMLPTQINDRLMFLGRFSSGTVNDTFVAFVPVTTEPQGGVLKTKLSGISMLRLDYTARLHQTFSFCLQSSYFVRSDLQDIVGLPSGPTGYFLGNEFYGFVKWSPVSDIQITIGGGAFLPSLGNVDKKGGTLWSADLSVVLALF